MEFKKYKVKENRVITVAGKTYKGGEKVEMPENKAEGFGDNYVVPLDSSEDAESEENNEEEESTTNDSEQVSINGEDDSSESEEDVDAEDAYIQWSDELENLSLEDLDKENIEYLLEKVDEDDDRLNEESLREKLESIIEKTDALQYEPDERLEKVKETLESVNSLTKE